MKITIALIYTKLNLLVALIIAKKNAEDDLRELLENSAIEPTLDLLHKSNNLNPTPPKLRFVSPPEEREGVGGGVLGTFARGLL